MKTFLTLLFLFFLFSSQATNYYFSTLSGDDSRSSAQASHSSTPWKTIGKLNKYFRNLQPGDSILFKCGEVFYGSIKVNRSGKAGSPIVIGAFGTGDQPVITSLVTLDKWVFKGNGIWESQNSSLGWTVNTLLLNNEAQQIGRYPNISDPDKGYLTLESHFRTHYFIDNELTSATNWEGAEVIIRKRRWILDRNRVKIHSGNKITYVATSAYPPIDNYGYFFQNHIRTLDQFGEWCYNRHTKKLSVYFGKNTPSSYTIQATAIENLISSSKVSDVVFDNLNVKGANAEGITIKNGSNIKIKNCNIQFSGKNGVTVNSYKNLKIENCTISNSNNNGIDLGSRGSNATIRNNKIINTSVFAGMGASGDSKGIAIVSNGNDNIIEYNEIRNTGYIGIRFDGNHVTIKNNLIDSFCTTKDDGSGIYTFTGSSNANWKSRKVIGNIIMNGIGVAEGVTDPNPFVIGIYMDDNASGVEIIGNTITNVPSWGIFLHNARKITVADNTLFDNKVQLSIVHDTKGDPVRNCIITKNNFFSNSSSQNALSIQSIKKDKNLMGRFIANYYARPLDNKNLSYHNRVKAYEALAAVIDFDKPIRFVYNSSPASKTITLDGDYFDVKNNKYSNKIVLQPFTSEVLIEHSGSIKNSAPKVSITSPEINATYKAKATISMSAIASDDDGSIKKVEFYNGTTLLDTESNPPYIYSWQDVPAGTYTLIAKATDNSGNITTSDKVSISVTSFSSPGENNTGINVKITSPEVNATYKAKATIHMRAIASDADGSIKKVQFYNGRTLLETENNPPYIYSWKNVPAGTYTLIAKATDNSGNIISSDKVSISVTSSSSPGENNTGIKVKIISPEVDATYKAKATIYMRAIASDADGSIKKVQFYNGTTLLNTEYVIPYTHTWKHVAPGTYTITAKAIDNRGNETTSESVTITVKEKNKSKRSSQNNETSAINLHPLPVRPEIIVKPKVISETDKQVYDLKVSPNPAVNKIQINLNAALWGNRKATLNIQNLSGIMVKSMPVIVSGKTIEADVSYLITGVYIVSIVTDDFIISRKFVKN